MSEPEIHAVVVWSTALDSAGRITADLRERFELVGCYRVEWTRERFAENLRRLYGFALPERVDKTVGSGTDPFLLFVVRDPAPRYAARPRSWGVGIANAATYDAKYRYREWTGGGFRVHTTINREEAGRDLFLLLGRRAESFAAAPALDWKREPEPWARDVLGADGWGSREELLEALDLTTGYALLRHPATLVVGAAKWAGDLAGPDSGLELRALDRHWQRAILSEATRDAHGLRVATAEHRFHVRLDDVVRTGGVLAEELEQLAREAAAPPGPYDDPAYARAALDEFLYRNGWLPPPKRRRGRELARRAAAKLRPFGG